MKNNLKFQNCSFYFIFGWQIKRLMLLGAAAICEGASIGTFGAQVLKINPK